VFSNSNTYWTDCNDGDVGPGGLCKIGCQVPSPDGTSSQNFVRCETNGTYVRHIRSGNPQLQECVTCVYCPWWCIGHGSLSPLGHDCRLSLFNGPPPFCSACGNITNPGLNATACNGLGVGESCNVTCLSNGVLVGSPTLKCDIDAQGNPKWSTLPQCACVTLNTTGTGRVAPACTNLMPGQTCQVSCKAPLSLTRAYNGGTIVCDISGWYKQTNVPAGGNEFDVCGACSRKMAADSTELD
jgi:hypothetical protein